MATTSTVPTVKARLVTVIKASLATAGTDGGQIPTTYAWPGPETESEAVFLGPHPQTADIRLNNTHDIPTIKAGRKQRQEDYDVRVTIWSFRPDLTPADAAECEARAYAIFALIESVFAADPKVGLSDTILTAKVGDSASTLFPFQKGWATELGVDISVSARLK